MRQVFWMAMIVPLLTLTVPSFSSAQDVPSNAPSRDLRAGPDDASPDTGRAPSPSSTEGKQGLQPTVEQKVDALMKRVTELETEVKQARAALLADSADAAAMKAAEKELLAGDNASVTRTATPTIVSAVPTATVQDTSTSAPIVSVKDPHAPAFSDWDWTWLNGNPRNKDVAFDSKFFTPEIRADITYNYDFNKPTDDTVSGSSELFRANELQLEQLGLGGDFHLDNAHARFMTQFGMYSTATIRNDPSFNKGQWDIADADRYLAEAYGGYQIPNVMHGLNFDAGIFMSYIGLFSYYNFDNWAYQPSYVSSNTPWFFEGIRIQMFPTEHLKIEPWIINGWQSYGSSNSRKGLGGQIKWTPYSWMNVISNNYGLGHDDLYLPNRGRLHTDNSVEVKYFDKPTKPGIDKMAFSFTGDLGCEFGNGVSCHNDSGGNPKQAFLGYMLYDRTWLHKDKQAFTIGAGQINNPGLYLVLVPPINGESAGSSAVNSPYFQMNPGDPFKAWDTSFTYDFMPRQWFTWRWEYGYRHASIPYWTGHGGMTPPAFAGAPYGTNNGSPTQFACMDGSTVSAAPGQAGQVPYGTTGVGVPSYVTAFCGANNSGPHAGVWYPDLRKDEQYIDIDLMVKF